MAANIPTAPTAPQPGSAPVQWTEAPASATLRVVTPQGYEILLTNRANTMSLLLGQLAALETWLSEHNWTPAPTRTAAAPAAQAQQGEGDAPLCPTHGKPMRQGKGGGWFCPVKVADDDGTGKPVYCRQRK